MGGGRTAQVLVSVLVFVVLSRRAVRLPSTPIRLNDWEPRFLVILVSNGNIQSGALADARAGNPSTRIDRGSACQPQIPVP